MQDFIEIAKEVFEIESEAILELKGQLSEDFNAVVECILKLKGHCVITGMGKSGHIAEKIAATLASTGTPSFFLHPGEALHGDLGMLTKEDAVIAISNSGESEEILRIIPIIKKREIPLIVMSGNPKSTMAKEGKYFLNVAVKKEACPLQLAPTSSTTATLAMGDAIAVALMKARGFKPENFAMFHPGGSLGRKLLTQVKDIMVSKELPIVNLETNFKDLITEMTSKRLGVCLVLDNGRLVGIITDGDLRRALMDDKFDSNAAEIMTKQPKTIQSDAMATQAESLMMESKIKELVVMEGEKVVGIVQLYEVGRI
ncbi:KpsF/GutQ family sugar-phosphate isomerase [Helicobacter pullorum]|uniref:Arabinose 5-phosphate isomerase n=2 Tax=Helicobacter pullorum TaxID=35818 RepID=A0A0N1EB89_9HELI|nr:KpsF/GutQ family sugar-phosphate isomerase [Helicobacter pullorum]EEQ63958.1 arabinose 5-phosphate isomerase [Helicobacter pullorum MIT 98-5489]KAB0574286.1 KpsF/GutQ family sugar-phosphate isomerase [Helicobacter pullorum NCTC 12824]KPH51874.1 arabinose 5-phosphate isomerase [Helicobacter pullorum]KPH55197.1 arabinose 5-phosphate isomerase [Helicobacter pullorum]OCR13819.1 arabinose-5-phosphate isomerase [Helicobacter pullorum]